jgi:hypothetical protein
MRAHLSYCCQIPFEKLLRQILLCLSDFLDVFFEPVLASFRMRHAAFGREVGVLANAMLRGDDEVLSVESANEDNAAVRLGSELVGTGRMG